MIYKLSEEDFFKALAPQINECFSKDESVAIKLHMGEQGNKTHISPRFVKRIVQLLQDIGAKPFLFDSPVLYPGGRDTAPKYLKTAKENGFSAETMGCEVIISNDFKIVDMGKLKVEVCSKLIEADSMLVVSHIKGHMCSGFGGSIKNLGMGAVSSKTKGDIHSFAKPIITSNCSQCKICIKACPVNAITAKSGKISINYDGCWGCGQCIEACPSNAMQPKVDSFDNLLSLAAYAVLREVKKSFFINAMVNITQLCDCCTDSGPLLSKDKGYIFAEDIVEADRISLQLLIEHNNYDIFRKAHKKDPMAHVDAMDKYIHASEVQ